MNISEAIQMLQEQRRLHGDLQVIMSADGEGNSYSPLDDFGLGVYTPETTWYGEVDMGEDIQEGVKYNCIVLWPTN